MIRRIAMLSLFTFFQFGLTPFGPARLGAQRTEQTFTKTINLRSRLDLAIMSGAGTVQISEGPAGRVLNFRTNVDDWVACGPDHPLRFEPEAGTGGLKPYLHVRRDLWAKVTRALFFDLVELGEERELEGSAMFGVASMGKFFPMAPAEQVRDFA